MAEIMRRGKRLYRIDISETRSTVIYVLAEDYAAAREDADELSRDAIEGELGEMELSVAPARREPPDTAYVWTGGPDGNDVSWAELTAEATA